MKIHVGLNSKSISNAIQQIEQFKNDLLSKMELFCTELAEVGIEVIQDNVKIEVDGEVRNFGDSVMFKKDMTEP